MSKRRANERICLGIRPTPLAQTEYYAMTAAERGLLVSMMHAYWLDGRLPVEPRLLSRAVRLEVNEVEDALTDSVRAAFRQEGNDLYHPDLREQRRRAEDKWRKQSAGGANGARTANGNRTRSDSAVAKPATKLPANPAASSQVPYSKSLSVGRRI